MSASQGYVSAFVRLYGIYEKVQNDLAMLFLKVAALKGNHEAQFKFAALQREDSSDIENEDIENETFLAALSVMCAVGNKEAIRLKSNIEICPEMFGEY